MKIKKKEAPSQWRGDKYKTGWLNGDAVRLSKYDAKKGYITTTNAAGHKHRVSWNKLESAQF